MLHLLILHGRPPVLRVVLAAHLARKVAAAPAIEAQIYKRAGAGGVLVVRPQCLIDLALLILAGAAAI